MPGDDRHLLGPDKDRSLANESTKTKNKNKIKNKELNFLLFT